MTVDDPIGIIELGNFNIKCLIFKISNNNVEILSTSITPSDGFHNDIVVNLSKASSAIRACISNAEKKAKIPLKKINVVFEQPDFLCTKFSKHKKIDGSKIHKDDIEFLLKEAKKQLILNDKKQSIIHIFNHNYIVDGKKFIEEPIDVHADSLTHEITFISIPKNNLISFIIGGNNRHYKFTKESMLDLINKIKHLKKRYSKFNFLVISSRRTGLDIIRFMKEKLDKIAHVWNSVGENPYIFALNNSIFFVVTSDSTSMISECAFTGKPIFVFHLPFKRLSKRIKNFHYFF